MNSEPDEPRSLFAKFRTWLRKDRLTDDPRGLPKQAELENPATFTPGGLNLEQFCPDRNNELADPSGGGTGGVGGRRRGNA
jgi:hypothetical protein